MVKAGKRWPLGTATGSAIPCTPLSAWSASSVAHPPARPMSRRNEWMEECLVIIHFHTWIAPPDHDDETNDSVHWLKRQLTYTAFRTYGAPCLLSVMRRRRTTRTRHRSTLLPLSKPLPPPFADSLSTRPPSWTMPKCVDFQQMYTIADRSCGSSWVLHSSKTKARRFRSS